MADGAFLPDHHSLIFECGTQKRATDPSAFALNVIRRPAQVTCRAPNDVRIVFLKDLFLVADAPVKNFKSKLERFLQIIFFVINDLFAVFPQDHT